MDLPRKITSCRKGNENQNHRRGGFALIKARCLTIQNLRYCGHCSLKIKTCETWSFRSAPRCCGTLRSILLSIVATQIVPTPSALSGKRNNVFAVQKFQDLKRKLRKVWRLQVIS